MTLFRKTSAAVLEDRRMVHRYGVDCPARLRMPGGDRDGRLSDLSEAGARFETSHPPVQGISALLAWGAHEFFGRVVWSRDGVCGLMFDRPIPLQVVEETCELIEVASVPIANFGRIPVAQRGRRAALVSRG